ncbi:MAG: 3-ketoacyl-ACP reductase [Eubacteriales bacterium]
MKKLAVVTGARRGIGLAIARKLGEEGYSLLLCATSPDAEDALCALSGLDAQYVPCDISNPADRAALFDRARAIGRLDVLVNNAGVAPTVRLDVLETTEESFERLMRINLEGTFFMCQAGARLMLELRDAGLADYHPRIVNLSSISEYTSSTSRGEYCVSKAGIGMVTKLFADRLAGEGIPVFEVRPGIILTDMTAKVREKYEKLIAEGLLPIARMGTPEDVANAVAAACSGLLDYSAGQVLDADGGFSLRRL